MKKLVGLVNVYDYISALITIIIFLENHFCNSIAFVINYYVASLISNNLITALSRKKIKYISFLTLFAKH